MSTKITMRTILTSLLLVAATSCAATVNQEKTALMPMVSGVKVQPPQPGKNSVYVEFRDLTASGLEDQAFEALCDAVEARGWVLANNYHAADYVLWADLRLFTEAGTEEGNQALNRLGGVAAGAAVGVAVAQATDNWWVGAGAGYLGGTVTKAALDMATQIKRWQMVIDLVLGRKIEGGVRTESTAGQDAEVRTQAGQGTAIGSETASDRTGQSTQQTMEEVRVHYDLTQRLLAVAEGRRMTKSMAQAELVPKLVEGLKSQLPRVR